MNYKKFFSATALATLLSLSHTAFSDPVGPDAEETSYYVRAQYNGEFFNMMSGKGLKSNGGSGTSFTALKGHLKTEHATSTENYQPKYKTSFFAGSVAGGYKLEDIRVELEALYSKLDIDGSDYKGTDGQAKSDNAKVFGEVGLTSGNATTTNNHYIGSNEGFTNIAGLVNAYYDLNVGEDIPVTPYIGVGAGMAKTNFAGKDNWKIAYQGKVGVSYAVTPEIKVYGGYRYFGLYGNEFKDVILTQTTTTTAEPPVTTTATKTVTLQQDGRFGVHGIEAGVMFNF